ncbi:hypothetical protein ACEWY4_021183 [Coilia grayii]|uniref:Cyclic nucleotide-binding domain-containing protein n=1 Tax=Coilia grayii TaxID=363190 RepID=A0ABD1JA02_9TELE
MGNGSIKGPRVEENGVGSSGAGQGVKVVSSGRGGGGGVEREAGLLRGRVARLEEELARRERELQAQEVQLQALRRELEAKLSQIDKLQDAIGYHHHGNAPWQCSPPLLPTVGIAGARQSRRLLSVINQAPVRFQRVAVEVHRRLRAKEGVSAEPTSGHFGPSHHHSKAHHLSGERARVRKDSSTRRLINEALMNNDFLKKLEQQHMREMVDCMYERVYAQQQLVIQEGQPGNYLYVLAEGLLEVIQNGKLLGQMRAGTAFGELAILYNCKRTATVKAVAESHIWALDRQTFQKIMMRSTQARNEEYFSFLRSNFNQMVGTYEELQAYLREYVEQLSRSDEKRNAVPQSPLRCDSSPEAQEQRRLREKLARLSSTACLHHLQPVATLGMGGFGRVELVKLKDEDTGFALKCIKKKHIVDTRQQEHIYSEKNILQQTHSKFIVKGIADSDLVHQSSKKHQAAAYTDSVKALQSESARALPAALTLYSVAK